MAGSWQHMTTKSGKLRNNESFCDLIGNLGDAYEAAEECYGMVWFLASALGVLRDGRGERENLQRIIAIAEENYREGLVLGGVQKPR